MESENRKSELKFEIELEELKMKKSTKERIAENHDRKKLTYIGRYAYDLQYNPGAHADYIIRCPREDVGREWIGFDGEYINGWEFVEPYFD